MGGGGVISLKGVKDSSFLLSINKNLPTRPLLPNDI